MKITDVVGYLSPKKFYVKVETDAGIVGFGESSPMRPKILAEVLREIIRPQALGTDPFAGEWLEERIMAQHYKLSGNLLAAAYSGFDIALWDVRGKFLKQPVYNLLGGRYRPKVALYGSSMSRHLPPQEEALKARNAVEQGGFSAIKIKVGPRYGTGQPVDLDQDVAKVAAVREAIGPDIKLMIDANGSYTVAEAIALYRRIRDLDIYFFEEPCPYCDLNAYAALARQLPVALNVGEQEWNLVTFRDWLSRGACHFFAADPIKCGGLTNAKRAAVLCRAFGITYAPHNTTRSIGFAAALHLATSSPECRSFYEYSIEPGPPASPGISLPIHVAEGYAWLDNQPGLGVEADERALGSALALVR
ncbi:MAG: mandelate racemase/muconate lactonizing enzyme family protein [Firmicutes bacterium]|nr:mandelate racemase/muconate lactonizing enzyme family protein [Bacillota bacterium]